MINRTINLVLQRRLQREQHFLIDCCAVTRKSRENSLKALHTNVTEHNFFDGFEVS